jgi:co-chaperonin GroES (HSP10)
MLQALKQTVIVEQIQQLNTTESGLIVTGVTEPQTEGRIVSVGPTVTCGLQVGDRVVVDWTRVGRLAHDGKIYYVTGQSNIIGVFED